MPETTTRLFFEGTLGGKSHRIVELFGSRDGSSEGNGASYPRRFRMFIDMEPADFDSLRHPSPTGLLRTFIPYGSAHPWNAYAIARNYEVVRQEAPGRFLLQVTYVVPDPSTGIISTGWLFSGRSLSIPITRHVTPDGDVVGPRLFIRDPANGTFFAEWREEVLDDDGNVTGFAEKSTKLADSKLRKDVGFDIQLSAITITLTRVVSRFDLTVLPLVVDHAKKLNATAFLGAEPGHVMFEDWSVDEVAPTEFDNVDGGIRQIGGPVRRDVMEKYSPIIGALTRAVRVSLTFIHAVDNASPDLSPFDASWLSTWSVGGAEAVVTTDADHTTPVVERQQIVERRDFNSFMERMTS